MLLAIDSSTRTLSLALHDGTQVCAESTWMTANRHTVELTPAIQHLLSQATITTADLRLLAVAQGPGSFNGLRIGFSVAKGLALALTLPLITIPTLDISAAAHPPFDGRLIAVAQAGRGRVCACSYDWRESQWQSRSDTQIVAWEPLLDTITAKTAITGEIDADGQAAIDRRREQGIQVASPAVALRRAGFLAELAWTRWRISGEKIGDPAAAVPFYLHQPGVPHP